MLLSSAFFESKISTADPVFAHDSFQMICDTITELEQKRVV